jgi:tetratricopeptide (TPR) repeat protein
VILFALLLPAPGADARKKKDDDAKKGSGLNKHVAEALLEANEKMDDDKYDAALAIVDKAAKRRKLKAPDLAQIHRFRGYILINKNMTEEGAKELQLSLDQHGLDGAAEQVTTYSLAQLYTQLGQYDRALALIDTWFQSAENPKPDAYYLKAMILVQQEKPEAALEPAKTAIASSPSPRESWVQLLAAIYIQLRDYPNVAATLERLISMSPDKKQYWVQLAAVQHHLEKDARASATLRLADQAELLSDDKEFRQLARLLFLRDQPYECAKTVEAAIAVGVVTADADAYKLIANCYLAARENDRALEPLTKAAEMSPDGDMYMLLGQMHLQRDRFAPAIDALQKSLAKAKPEQRGTVHLLIGVAELGADDLDAAERAFRAAQSDAKVRRAADSYLEYLQEQRAQRVQPESVQTASRN